jgi:hypothetical protein
MHRGKPDGAQPKRRRLGIARFGDRDNTTFVVGELRAKNARLLRRRQLIAAIHGRGGLRPIVELIEELIRRGHVAEAEVDRLLAIYGRADPTWLRATGADQLPALPMRIVAGHGR